MEYFGDTTTEADDLVKPDMKAVLTRTNLPINARGFLLPVFESLSNSVDGIEHRLGDRASSEGKIKIRFENLNEPDEVRIVVTDNGIGLDRKNYESFKTPYSGFKLKRHGRGFGRFITFKVFSKVRYWTRFATDSEIGTRSFIFDINMDDEIEFLGEEPDFDGFGLRVEFDILLDDWKKMIAGLSEHDVKEEIGSHFLPYYLSRDLPEIRLQFDGGPEENITESFKRIFTRDSQGEFQIKIDDIPSTLSYTLTKIPKRGNLNYHRLYFTAADRIVGRAHDLSNLLGEKFFEESGGKKFIIVVVVKGDSLEKRSNDSRTSLDLPQKDVGEIVKIICEKIENRNRPQIRKIKDRQISDLNQVLRENPIFRLGLKGKSLSEYVDARPNNWKREQFDEHLALEHYRDRNELFKKIADAVSDHDSYVKEIKELTERIDEEKKGSLGRVCHT